MQRIFKLAYAKKKPSQPLSRRLRLFYDEIVFRKIKIDSSSRIRTLHTLLAGRPGLGAHICELVIEEVDAKSCLSLDEIKAIFACLGNLQALSLRVHGPEWLEAALPEGPDAKTALPNSTVSLTIVPSTTQRSDAYDPAHLGALAQLPNLTKLALDVRRSKYKYKALEEPNSTKSDLVLPNVTNLSVGLPKVPSSVNAFVGCFPQVRKLTLTSHADAPDFATALASIKSPAEVVELTIRASPKAEWRFPEELAAYSSLDLIVLAGQFQHLESDAYKPLGHTPITALAVGKKERHLGQRSNCPPWGRGRLPDDQDIAPQQSVCKSASPPSPSECVPPHPDGYGPTRNPRRVCFASMDYRVHVLQISRAGAGGEGGRGQHQRLRPRRRENTGRIQQPRRDGERVGRAGGG